ncbi:unnamed protein product [Brassicogethes aeneus]|uniref:non-specific serine/threonine protein kinase n=1 Tax=Brassicogethes aeneus TaxID=1431903 RepID=A0A9P0B0F2_BRAAE|nr:unnamed protein product [Brassicogethes aeneus]
MSQASIFVEDWLCYNTNLGEGAYGEVKLLLHRKTKEKIACKMIDHDKYKDASLHINREVMIHKFLDHENIIKYYGRRQEPAKEYIFLEYASGGELFQMIEPDIGMPSSEAQKFMKQLMNGIKYLHGKGIAHRDIKPENLLIGADGKLKISDFGMATLFRFKGKERLLDKKCGTKPYLAPEVLQRPYYAQPADIWSCGIVLVAMLTGELPWADTTNGNEEFIKWKNEEYLCDTPWRKLGNTALALSKQILNIDSEKRLTLEQVQKHPWMKFQFGNDDESDVVDSSGEKSAKRWNSMMEAETRQNADTPDVALSQPNLPSSRKPASLVQLLKELNEGGARNGRGAFFSQPAQNADLMTHFAQSTITKENFQDFIKSMTRFYVKSTHERTLECLCNAFEQSHYTWAADASGAVVISTVDLMKNPLVFKVNLLKMDGKVMLDFRLSKGCGLEFKKKFLKLKESLKDIVDNKNI